jgi:hypothetical protein
MKMVLPIVEFLIDSNNLNLLKSNNHPKIETTKTDKLEKNRITSSVFESYSNMKIEVETEEFTPKNLTIQ